MTEKPFGKRNQKHLQKIQACGNNKNMVEIKYLDRKGNLSSRTVEPYKIEGEDFWGFDPDKNGIRRFKIRSLRSVKPTNQNYEPRWNIEMDKIAHYENLIYKQAKVKDDVEFYPHQKKSINRPGDSVIYAHAVGSGKTLTGIARFEKLKGENKAHKALVVVPAGLRNNFGANGVGKFTDSKYNVVGNKQEISSGMYHALDPNADYNILSYEVFRQDPERYLRESGADTVITDESHRGKNEYTATAKALRKTRSLYKNYIGLTGSVISNEIGDVVPLVDVASNGAHKLGKDKNDFSRRYLKRSTSKAYAGLPQKRKPVVGFDHENTLSKELKKYVDYLDDDDVRETAKIPQKKTSLVRVPVTKQQARIYKDLLDDNESIKKMIRAKRLEVYKDDEIANAFSKLVEARKLMNSVGSVHPNISMEESAKITPKTKRMLDDLEKHLKSTPDGQAIILSHLINGGTDVVEAGLKDRHINYGKFIGKGNQGITEQTRQKDVEDYNNRKKKVMILSSAGGEGLSLGDTTWEGVLDPHYNPEKMKQMEARGIRSGGLSHRSPENRSVNVNRYMATMPKTFGIFESRYRTPDEFIYEIAQNKSKQNQMFYNFLKQKNNGGTEMNKAAFYENEIMKVANLMTQPDLYYQYNDYKDYQYTPEQKKGLLKKKVIPAQQKGKNLVMISGYSGSGKSTLARQIAEGNKAHFVEMDDFKKLKDSNPNAPIVSSFFEKHPELKGKVNQMTYKKYFPQYLEFAVDYAKQHPDKKYVFEGIQLLDYENPEMPRIVKGTGAIRSSIQAEKRNFAKGSKQHGIGYEFLNASLAPKMNKERFMMQKLTEGYKPEHLKTLMKQKSRTKAGVVGALASGLVLGNIGNRLGKEPKEKVAVDYEEVIYKIAQEILTEGSYE